MQQYKNVANKTVDADQLDHVSNKHDYITALQIYNTQTNNSGRVFVSISSDAVQTNHAILLKTKKYQFMVKHTKRLCQNCQFLQSFCL